MLFFACSEEMEDFVEIRVPIPDLIDPNTQPNELNDALTVFGTQATGAMPDSRNPEDLTIDIFVPSAVVTSDNFLFLPFSFTSTETIRGMYLQVSGSESYWTAMFDNNDLDGNSLAIAIGIPDFVLTGAFDIAYKVYDDSGNISEVKSLNVTVIPAENRCGNGQGFPRVNGSDGITVRTYDMGDVAGQVRVSYFMYTQKDRMDIRYNNNWIKSTSVDLLQDGQAPPFKTCELASPNEGFVSGGGNFIIDYDPAVSRELSIYVSGCLQGGTEWYFNVNCPDGGQTNPPGQVVCNQPSVQDYFDPANEDYHLYPEEGDEIYTEICNTMTDDNCTRRNVFSKMLEQSNFIAPTSDRTAVTSCKVTWVDGFLPGDNPVVSTVNSGRTEVTNYTLANIPNRTIPFINSSHFLHPGKVVRTVVERDGRIGIITIGEGTGFNPLNANNWLAGSVWKGVDREFKEYWDE